ncbi:MAG: Pr6Pr family membrane protein [Clostridiales bacterium]|jgi:hypothetical protein|nr:Pr6Pr family membrane protein [Clostridiales bacterium]
MKKILSFWNLFLNGKAFALITLAVCLTTVVLVFLRVANWSVYYALYEKTGGGSFPNNVSGLNFFAYFTEITTAVFTFFLTLRAVSILFPKSFGLDGNAENKNGNIENNTENSAEFKTQNGINENSESGIESVAELKMQSGIKKNSAENQSETEIQYQTEIQNGNSGNKARRGLITAASKIKNLIENPDINCALATYAAVGFVVVSAGEAGGFMTRYADTLFVLNAGNIWMHFVVFPFFILAILPRKSAKKADLKKLPFYLAFPLAYFTFSMIRGIVTGWYPYPFLNPAALHGLLFPGEAFNPIRAALSVTAAALFLAAFIYFTGLAVIKFKNKNLAG